MRGIINVVADSILLDKARNGGSTFRQILDLLGAKNFKKIDPVFFQRTVFIGEFIVLITFLFGSQGRDQGSQVLGRKSCVFINRFGKRSQ